ncbi:hypothetical protein BU17DRAFT_91786 [Hysterangium stoloniferum]|nr:hypothetical protein BU17DRAFT_91786 [Hysterangium stoloniferum]
MLCNQPPEIVDAIISKIEHPLDLLHLALTRKSFKNLIIPWHIQYRVIFAHLFNPSIWELLASRPDVASRVHKLDVATGRRPNSRRASLNGLLKVGQSLFPMELSKEQEANCLVNFHVAVSLMVNLYRFSIQFNHENNFVWPLEFTNTLMGVAPRHIREMCLCPPLNRINGLHWYDECFKILQFSHLTRLCISGYDGDRNFDQNLLNMLRLNPRLRDLCVVLCWSQFLVVTLREAHLPELVRFTLGGGPVELLSEESTVDIFNFFRRHNELESLFLFGRHVAPGVFHPNMLPGLKHLKIQISEVLPIGFGKQLRHLNITLDAKCVPLLSHMTELVIMDVTTDCIFPWAGMTVLPKLQILRWRSRSNLYKDDVDTFVDQLSIFPDLRYLDMIGHVKLSDARVILEKATVSLPLLEGLRFIFTDDEEQDQIFEIKRVPQADGDKYGYILTMVKVVWGGLRDVDENDPVLSGGKDCSDDFYTGTLKLNFGSGLEFDQNLLNLLRHSPRLRDLHIELNGQRLVATLRRVHLPELLRLTLGGGPDQFSNSDLIVDMFNFFSRHNGLESLRLYRMRVASSLFHPDMLLGLKYLKLGGFPLRVESGVLPTGFGKQLRYLNIILDPGCVPLLSHMTELVIMDVTTKYIIPWATMEVLPKLQILRWRSHLKLDNDDIEKFVDHLSTFPNLRCLHMIGYVKRSNARAILEKATTILPLLEDLRLKFADDEDPNQIFEIKRVPDGDTYGYIPTMVKEPWRLHQGGDRDPVLSSGGRDFSGDFYTGELKLNVSQI